MSADNTQQKLMRWASDCSHVIGNHMDLCQPLFEKSHLESKLMDVIRQLMVGCHVTSESALLLIGYGRLWDTEMLIRSVVEGSLRFTYLCNLDDLEREGKVKEFWESIPEYEDIRTHNKIKYILSQVDNPDADEWKPFRDLILSDEYFQQIQKKYPQGKKMEQNWTFNNLTSRTRIPEIPDLDFRILQFNYGMSSHLLHKDAIALQVMRDRVFRDEARRNSVELAHGARMIGDIHILSVVRMILLHKIHAADMAIANRLANTEHKFLKDMQLAVHEWHKIEYE